MYINYHHYAYNNNYFYTQLYIDYHLYKNKKLLIIIYISTNKPLPLNSDNN